MCDLQYLGREFHFFFECKRNTNNRNIVYQYFQNIYSNFLELNHEEKLTKILNPSTNEQIRTVTSFIRVIRTERGRLVSHHSHNCSSCYCIFYVVMYALFVLSVHVYYVNCNAKAHMDYLCALIK